MIKKNKSWRKKRIKADEMSKFKNIDINLIEKGIWIVQCDAGYKDSIAGISILIKTYEKEYEPIDLSRKANGPVHAELLAIYYALNEIKKKKTEKTKVRILTDSRYALNFVRGLWTPSRKYIVDTLEKIKKIEKEISAKIEYIHVNAKINRRVDRRAKKARKKKEEEIQKRIEKRVMQVEECLRKSESIKIEEINGTFYTHSSKNDGTKYRVSLKPPSCECPAWNEKWKHVPEPGRRARRLPCKHICALASYLGEDIFKIFKKQIERKT